MLSHDSHYHFPILLIAVADSGDTNVSTLGVTAEEIATCNGAGSYRVQGLALTWKQFYALIVKRFLFLIRSRKSFLVQVGTTIDNFPYSHHLLKVITSTFIHPKSFVLEGKLFGFLKSSLSTYIGVTLWPWKRRYAIMVSFTERQNFVCKQLNDILLYTYKLFLLSVAARECMTWQSSCTCMCKFKNWHWTIFFPSSDHISDCVACTVHLPGPADDDCPALHLTWTPHGSAPLAAPASQHAGPIPIHILQVKSLSYTIIWSKVQIFIAKVVIKGTQVVLANIKIIVQISKLLKPMWLKGHNLF